MVCGLCGDNNFIFVFSVRGNLPTLFSSHLFYQFYMQVLLYMYTNFNNSGEDESSVVLLEGEGRLLTVRLNQLPSIVLGTD